MLIHLLLTGLIVGSVYLFFRRVVGGKLKKINNFFKTETDKQIKVFEQKKKEWRELKEEVSIKTQIYKIDQQITKLKYQLEKKQSKV